MKLLMAAAVAIGLGFVLIWRNPAVTKGVYRFAFFLGLATFAAFLFFPESSWFVKLGRGPFASLAALPFVLLAMAPFTLLVESGIAGYRGFSSWMRYLSLVLAVLGGVGLMASLLVPRLLRR